MALIVILICLALQHYWQLGLRFSRAQWLKAYLMVLHPLWGKGNFWYTLGGIILLLLPLPILAGIIDVLLKGWLFDLLQLLFQVGVVWFCLNAYDYHLQSRDDEVFLQIAEQLFGVLFWYLLLGAAGAVGYYSVLLLARQNFNETERFRPAAQQLLNILAWAPLRIVAVVFALAGHFSACWEYCLQHILSKPSQNKTFITEAGLAALGKLASDSTPEQTLQATLQLVDRTLFIVLVFLAIFTLGGWIM
ncbi:MAG: regulatory signaling modulator protein AmpE [Gammaproteobacteria bacterium]